MADTVIVEAVGFAAGHDGTAVGVARSKYIEAFVSRAIRRLQADGVTDTEIIRAAILKARDDAVLDVANNLADAGEDK